MEQKAMIIGEELAKKYLTPEDVIVACGGTLPAQPELPLTEAGLPEPAAEAEKKQSRLPWWRRMTAIL